MPTQRVTIGIENLPSAAASALITASLAHLPGVVFASVNPLTEMAYVAYDPGLCSDGQLQETIRRLGFRPEAPGPR